MRSKSQETLDAILKFVNKYYQQNRNAPSIIEVADGVGVGKTTAYRYLQELSERGLLEYSRGIAAAPKSAKMKTAYSAATPLMIFRSAGTIFAVPVISASSMIASLISRCVFCINASRTARVHW